jgi:hypothetical protein
MCDDVQLCNCYVREFLILARTWSAFGLPSKTGCDNNPMPPSVHTEDPASIHDRGICETDDMAQKWQRYNPHKMAHTSNGEAWKHFDAIHREKAEEAHNIRVALAIDGFNPYEITVAPYTCWPTFVIPINLPRRMLSKT